MDEPILYVLAAPLPGTRTPVYLLYQVGGLNCVLAYTDRERLVECCGEYQPWLGVRVGGLMADLRDQGLAGPAINMPLGPAARWTAGGPPAGRDRSAASTGGEPGAVTANAAETVVQPAPDQAVPGYPPTVEVSVPEAGAVAVTEHDTILLTHEVTVVAGEAAPAAPKVKQWWR
jgi:hypothetical protein